jgi:hypothetical protein
MPQNVKLGDIVVIRGAMLKWISGNSFLTDYHKDADYLFFSSADIPDPAFNAPHISEESRIIKHTTLPGKVVSPPIPAEQDYIIKLREWAKKHADALPQPGEQPRLAPKPPPPPSATPRAMANTSTTRHQLPSRPGFVGVPTGPRMGYQAQSGKFAHLKDVQCDKFHDLAGEVLKIWDNGHVIDMYISDYTFNPLLFDYKENGGDNDGRDGDPYNYTGTLKPKRQWQGPFGKHTICVALFEPHASFVRREITEGDFVKARNARCHVKGGNLQASLHEDRMHPDQVDVSKLSYTHELYKLVNTAKDAYMESRNAKPKTSGPKAPKRKRQKDKKAKEKAAAEAAARHVDAVEDVEDEPMEGDGLFVEDLRDKLNPKSTDLITLICNSITNAVSVIAAHPDRPTITLTKWLETPFRTYRDRHLGADSTLPFINQKCRLKVRVVDFFPPHLEDFAQSLDDPNYNDITSSHNDSTISMDGDSSPPSRFEWSFYLLVEDTRPQPGQEPTRIPILVHGNDAVHLLNLEPTDLRHNLQVKARLEQKLWTLWGNLEELKGDGEEMNGKVSNHPFECCVDEFGVWDEGVEGDGGEWKRVLRMRQTTIRDS